MAYETLDLCAGGAGGWSLGLEAAGFRSVMACEAVDWRRDLLSRNFPGIQLHDDLRTLTADIVRARLGYFPEIVAGSPPCKEYSEVNHRGQGLDGDDLFIHAARLVGEGRPRWAVFENSDRIRTRGYDRIASVLEGYGYACWPLVVELRSAGARHERPRAFILCSDLSRPQGRPARLSRFDRHLGLGADRPGRSFPFANFLRLGPAGSQHLGRHLRAYDGVSPWLAERCREAYGDAVSPALTRTVGRAILAADAELALC